MVRHAIGPMILAASILAVPVLAATTPNEAPNNSPAGASASGNNTSAGMTTTRSDNAAAATSTPADRNTTATAANDANATPLYTTSDGQMRIGKIVGASVYNDQRQSIGTVDDVLMSSNDKATTAVTVGWRLPGHGQQAGIRAVHSAQGREQPDRDAGRHEGVAERDAGLQVQQERVSTARARHIAPGSLWRTRIVG